MESSHSTSQREQQSGLGSGSALLPRHFQFLHRDLYRGSGEAAHSDSHSSDRMGRGLGTAGDLPEEDCSGNNLKDFPCKRFSLRRKNICTLPHQSGLEREGSATAGNTPGCGGFASLLPILPSLGQQGNAPHVFLRPVTVWFGEHTRGFVPCSLYSQGSCGHQR